VRYAHKFVESVSNFNDSVHFNVMILIPSCRKVIAETSRTVWS